MPWRTTAWAARTRNAEREDRATGLRACGNMPWDQSAMKPPERHRTYGPRSFACWPQPPRSARRSQPSCWCLAESAIGSSASTRQEPDQPSGSTRTGSLTLTRQIYRSVRPRRPASRPGLACRSAGMRACWAARAGYAERWQRPGREWSAGDVSGDPVIPGGGAIGLPLGRSGRPPWRSRDTTCSSCGPRTAHAPGPGRGEDLVHRDRRPIIEPFRIHSVEPMRLTTPVRQAAVPGQRFGMVGPGRHGPPAGHPRSRLPVPDHRPALPRAAPPAARDRPVIDVRCRPSVPARSPRGGTWAARPASSSCSAATSMLPLNGCRSTGCRPSGTGRSTACAPVNSMLARVVSKLVLFGMTRPGGLARARLEVGQSDAQPRHPGSMPALAALPQAVAVCPADGTRRPETGLKDVRSVRIMRPIRVPRCPLAQLCDPAFPAEGCG